MVQLLVATVMALTLTKTVILTLPELRGLSPMIFEHKVSCNTEGYFLHPKSTCWFYRCDRATKDSLFKPTFLACPPGTKFSDQRGICVYGKCGPRATTVPTNQSSSTSSTTTIPESSGVIPTSTFTTTIPASSGVIPNSTFTTTLSSDATSTIVSTSTSSSEATASVTSSLLESSTVYTVGSYTSSVTSLLFTSTVGFFTTTDWGLLYPSFTSPPGVDIVTALATQTLGPGIDFPSGTKATSTLFTNALITSATGQEPLTHYEVVLSPILVVGAHTPTLFEVIPTYTSRITHVVHVQALNGKPVLITNQILPLFTAGENVIIETVTETLDLAIGIDFSQESNSVTSTVFTHTIISSAAGSTMATIYHPVTSQIVVISGYTETPVTTTLATYTSMVTQVVHTQVGEEEDSTRVHTDLIIPVFSAPDYVTVIALTHTTTLDVFSTFHSEAQLTTTSFINTIIITALGQVTTHYETVDVPMTVMHGISPKTTTRTTGTYTSSETEVVHTVTHLNKRKTLHTDLVYPLFEAPKGVMVTSAVITTILGPQGAFRTHAVVSVTEFTNTLITSIGPEAVGTNQGIFQSSITVHNAFADAPRK